jgi:ubiquinone biosynthesis protein
MASSLASILRLCRAGVVLAQHGVRFVPAGVKVPWALHLARAATLPIRALTWPLRIGRPQEARVADALTSLGPSYIKLGQFLATRADLIGPELA